MPKTQPELQVKRMEQRRIKNEMPKDTVEEQTKSLGHKIEYIVSNSDEYPNTQEEVEKVITEALTTTYTKGVEDGRVEERKRLDSYYKHKDAEMAEIRGRSLTPLPIEGNNN